MKVLDPGHSYALDVIDGREGDTVDLIFVKRDTPSENYPGNIGHYPGVQIQEVLRALIDRCKYVNDQFSCEETELSILLLRKSLWDLEQRARRIRGQEPLNRNLLAEVVETLPTCPTCGHVQCLNHV